AAQRLRRAAGPDGGAREVRMDPARLFQLRRACLQPRLPRLLRPRTPLGQRRTPRVPRPGDIANALVAVGLAPRCASCAAVLDEPLRGPVCRRCWVDAYASGGTYDGALRDIIHAFKYEGR